MTKYEKWLMQQDVAYINELTNGEITAVFIDRNIRAITLDQLEELDTLYVCDKED